MASDTVTAPTRLSIDGCGVFAEPAEILTRLTPDDVHPARLAGPHAWHPWGLTVAPPDDRHLRLILTADTRPETAALILDRLERQLIRTPWPPAAPVAVHRRDSRLDCRDNDARRSLIEITVDLVGEDRRQAEVVTRDGWPILGELAALNDRIRCIDIDEPSRTDLADLARWVENKMAESVGTVRIAVPLNQLLANQAQQSAALTDRLSTVVGHCRGVAGHDSQVLAFLAEQISHCESLGRGPRH